MIKKNNFVLLGLVLLSACQYKTDKSGGLNQQQGALSDDQLSLIPQEAYDFSLIRSEILAPSCFQCHSGGGGNKAGVNLETYQNVKQFVTEIQTTVSQNFMPPRTPLTSQRKEILFQWIQMGMPEKASNPLQPPNNHPSSPPSSPPSPPKSPPSPPSESADYATVAREVFSPSCVRCHSAGDTPNLSNYASVKRVGASIKRVVSSNQMPPRNPLTESQKSILFRWIESGMPEKTLTSPAPADPLLPVNPSPLPQPPPFDCDEDSADDERFGSVVRKKEKCDREILDSDRIEITF